MIGEGLYIFVEGFLRNPLLPSFSQEGKRQINMERMGWDGRSHNKFIPPIIEGDKGVFNSNPF